jgi:hypothetical protein
MNELDWFVTTLESDFGVEVVKDQVSSEANELYLDEVDEAFVPNKLREGLPESLIFETMLYEDQQGTEWIGVIGYPLDTRKWHLQIILKNEESVLSKRVEKEND